MMRITFKMLTRKAVAAMLLAFMMLIAVEVSAAPPQGKGLKNRPDPAGQPSDQSEELLNRRPRPAQAMNDMLGGGAGMQLRLWARILKLTDVQIRQMRQIQRRNIEDFLALQDQIREKRQALERSIYKENFSEDETKQLATDLAKLQSQLVLMRVRVQTQIRLVLTPEQVHTFNEVRFGPVVGASDAKPEVERAPEEQKKN